MHQHGNTDVTKESECLGFTLVARQQQEAEATGKKLMYPCAQITAATA